MTEGNFHFIVSLTFKKEEITGQIDQQITFLKDLLNVSEDSVAYAIEKFPQAEEREGVYEDLKGYIHDLVEDFVENISTSQNLFNRLIDKQTKKIDDLSKRVPKTLDFSRTLGLKAFSQVCTTQKYVPHGLMKMRAEIVDYQSEEEKDIVEKCCQYIEYESLDNIGMRLGLD